MTSEHDRSYNNMKYHLNDNPALRPGVASSRRVAIGWVSRRVRYGSDVPIAITVRAAARGRFPGHGLAPESLRHRVDLPVGDA